MYGLLTKCVVKMYGLLTKCEVKMAEYWPSSVILVFLDRVAVGVHKLAKKEQGQYQAIFSEQAWSNKVFIKAFGEIFLAGYGG